MKDKIFSVLQRVGRSFMLPIAILPVAGLLLGIGSSFTNATTIETYGLTKILGEGTILHALLMIMNSVGSAVFNNLPLIFAVGVVIALIVCLIMKSCMKTARPKHTANDYIKKNSFHITRSRDIFIYAELSKRKRVKEESKK